MRTYENTYVTCIKSADLNNLINIPLGFDLYKSSHPLYKDYNYLAIANKDNEYYGFLFCKVVDDRLEFSDLPNHTLTTNSYYNSFQLLVHWLLPSDHWKYLYYLVVDDIVYNIYHTDMGGYTLTDVTKTSKDIEQLLRLQELY